MFDDAEKEKTRLEDVEFVPKTGKSISFKDVDVFFDNKIEPWGDVGQRKSVVGPAIRISSSKPGAIPDLEVGTIGTLRGARYGEEGFDGVIEDSICNAIVDSCNQKAGVIVFIANSPDHLTHPHSYSFKPFSE